MGWEIKGDAGKALDDTRRTIPELNIENHSLVFQNLADDKFTWSAKTTSAAGAGTIIPEAGQWVSVWNDTDRIFRGHCAKPMVGLDSVTVEILGPWWWMQRINLSGSIADSTGTSSDRTSYVFPTQGLKTSLIDLIDRMIAKGVPIARGTIHDMFTIPKVTLSNVTFATALAELLRWCPDAVVWFDYSVAPAEINIYRRGDMTALEYEIGVDNVESVSIFPRLDLEVSRVELHSMERRTTDGKPKWATPQTNGSAVDGKVQMITISGPEITDALPPDDFEKMAVKTQQVHLSMDWARRFDSVIQGVEKRFGALPGTKYDGGSIADAYWLQTGTVMDWMKKDHDIETRDQRVTGWVRSGESATGGYGAAGAELKKMGRLRHYPEQDYYEVWVDFTVPVINKSYATKKTLYKAWDYDFLSPPSGLASALKTAQAWVPWEGSVTLVADALSGYNGLKRKFNLAGGYAPWATMDTLVRAVRYDGTRSRWTYELGTPARTDYGSLVSRVRRSPQDNIVTL